MAQVESRTRATSEVSDRKEVLMGSLANDGLVQERMSRGWSQRRLAAVFQREARRLGMNPPSIDSMIRQINRVESGRTRVPAEFYQRLFCAAYEKTPAVLFGESDSPGPRSVDNGFAVTSHKFLPLYVGAELIADMTTA